ncbi:uncharacterized protein LOC130509786 [Raphanus sativus]|uniref:Uncharacterized protein LOC130509786 n=1 Tax=Raphanus sativus TaxID=3726 RepID=A0A9W3DDS3_RAPSA|nr:uncharacterized protein LOC130509786 [Raphanus sativus]
MKELLHIHKPIMLDSTNFGHWKVRMQHIIRRVDEDAWTSVEDGWVAPTVIMEDKSVDVEQFKIIQGCESAKQAWDTLINHFKGNTSVRRTRLDHLASKFENLRMSDDEPIEGFICKISELASEASVLSKKYEEKDLVKKLLRCLPPRFEAYKAVLTLAVDTDEMNFDQLSGILKVHDLEKNDRQATNQKSIAFKAESHDSRVTKIEENLSLIARNFNKYIKRMEKGNGRSSGRYQRNDSERSSSQSSRQESSKNTKKCHECDGFGHFRSECPLAKRKEQKCIECKDIGHNRSECPSILKKEKSLVSFSDTESDSDTDEGEMHQNFMALIGEETGKATDIDSEDDEDFEQDLEAEYKDLFNKFSDLSHENLSLLKETAMLKAQINILELDQPSVKTKEYSIDRESDQEVLALKRAMTEKERVCKEAEAHVQRLSDLLTMETDRSRLLESQLTENHKKIRMLSTGTASLDHILTLGQCPSHSTGLGYKGSTSTTTETKFVKEAPREERKPEGKPTHAERNNHVLPILRRRGNGCHFCGKRGHNVRFCYFRRSQYERAWRLNLCFTEPTAYGCVWIAKRDLYPNYKDRTPSVSLTIRAESHTEVNHDLVCNFVRIQEETEIVSHVAYTSAEEASQTQLPWYFDSGCSKHMTGNEDYLEKLELIRGGKVTFGDGGQGKICAIGITSRSDVPKLSNVYFVEGLKANLISVSQLCDEGLEVIFNSKECRAIDARNNVVLRGIRSGNNCYLWRPSNVCFAASESKLDLWHKKLGHMNTNGLNRLVSAEVVRGVPDLEKQTDTVCGGCCQGKQVKVQHKQISEIRSTRILELVHMDLMGPITPASIAGKRYIFVMVDDFSRYTWVDFLRHKSDALESFKIMALQLKQDKGGIIQIKSDHGGEFQNEEFDKFCHSQGIRHQYAAPRTPQQKGVVERKNRTLQEMARAMLCGNSVPSGFWAEAISTACYVINRVYVKPKTKTTPYEIFKGKTPNLSHLHVFGCLCYILNDKEHLGKFEARSDIGMFLGYSVNSSAYRVFNQRTKFIGDNVNVVFDDNIGFYEARVTQTIESVTQSPSKEAESEGQDEPEDNDDPEMTKVDLDQSKVHKNHSSADVIGGLFDERVTRKKQINFK